MCKHVAAVLYGVGNRLDEDASLFFTLRGIDVDELISQTVAETTKTLLDRSEHQSDRILQGVDLGDIFGIQLDDVDVPQTDLPPAVTSAPGKKKTGRKASRPAIAAQSRPARQNGRAAVPAGHAPAAARRTRTHNPVEAPAAPPQGTMLESLVKAVGRARRGKSVDQLQDKLGWTKTQVRNTITRASAQGWIETVKPGLYRQSV
jgi:uncharacterized Zn finger protein